MTLDGTSSIVRNEGDESILEAALRSGLDAPYSCTGGALLHLPGRPAARHGAHGAELRAVRRRRRRGLDPDLPGPAHERDVEVTYDR